MNASFTHLHLWFCCSLLQFQFGSTSLLIILQLAQKHLGSIWYSAPKVQLIYLNLHEMDRFVHQVKPCCIIGTEEGR
jgi:hypothetical protein